MTPANLGKRMSDAQQNKDPSESEAADDALEFFAHLTPEARERTLKFLAAVDQRLEGHRPTGSVESALRELLESIGELPQEERERVQRFLDARDQHLGSPRRLNS